MRRNVFTGYFHDRLRRIGSIVIALFLSLVTVALMMLTAGQAAAQWDPFAQIDGVLSGVALPPFQSAPAIVATKINVAIGNDDGVAHPGDTIRYTVVLTNEGNERANEVRFLDALDDNAELIAGSLDTTPLAADDWYTATGNVTLAVMAGDGLLINDVDLDGSGALTVVSDTLVSEQGMVLGEGGEVTIYADGSFEYNPPLGFSGVDSFTYVARDVDGNEDSATVFLTIPQVVWFIDNGATPGGDGRFGAPFHSLASFMAVQGGAAPTDPEPGDIIFVYEGDGTTTNLDSGIALLDGQQLIGEKAGLELQTLTIPAGNAPRISSLAGVGVDLAQDNVLRGLIIEGAYEVAISGVDFGHLLVRDVAIYTEHRAIRLFTGTIDLEFSEIHAVSLVPNVNHMLTLNTVEGRADLGEGQLSGASSAALRLVNSHGVFTYSGNIVTTDSNAGSLWIYTMHGGSVTFNGSITNTAGSGIDMEHNADTRITFAGGLNLNTGANPAFRLVDGGVVNVTGENNVITTTTATAVEIMTSTIGSDGLSFKSISVDGADQGIVLNNVLGGPFAVTGSGGLDGSGGTIQNVAVRGASLISASNTSLANMSFLNTATTDAIENCGALSPGGAGNVDCHAAIHLDNANHVSLTNVLIDGSAQQGINGRNVTDLALTDSVIRNAGDALHERGLNVQNMVGSLLIQGTSFDANYTDNARVQINGGSSLNMMVDGSQFNDAVNGSGFVIGASEEATVFYDITANAIQGNNAGGLVAILDSSSNAGSLLQGRLGSNNVVVPSGATGSGIEIVAEGAGSHVSLVENNTITYEDGALHGLSASAGNGNGQLDVTILTNTMAISSSVAANGITLNGGAAAGDAHTVCADIQFNEVTGVPVGSYGIDVSASQDTVVEISQGDAVSSDPGTVLVTNNPNALPVRVTEINAGDVMVVPAACAQPALDAMSSSDGYKMGLLRDYALRHPGQVGLRASAPSRWQADRASGQLSPVGILSKPVAQTTADVELGPFQFDVGQVLTVTFDVTVHAVIGAGVEELCNQAQISGSNFPSVLTDDPATGVLADATCMPLQASPDLAIHKDDGGASAVPGNVLVYALSYENHGTQHASNVMITETVPLHTVFHAAASSSGWSCTDGSPGGTQCVMWGGSVHAGTSPQAVQFAVLVDDLVASGVTDLENEARIADDGAGGVDPTPDDNVAMDTTPVNAAPDMQISKRDNGEVAWPGASVFYTLDYVNNGTQEASNVVLTETVPAHTHFNAAASTAGWVCSPDGSAGSVCTLDVGIVGAMGGSAEFVVDVDGFLPSHVSQITNVTSIGDDGTNGTDQNPANNSDSENTPVSFAADLALAMVDTPDPVTAGGTLTYTLLFRNDGPSYAQEVTLVDQLPTQVTVTQVEGVLGQPGAIDCAVSGQRVTCTVDVLSAGDTGQVRIVTLVASDFEGVVQNSASTDALTEDPIQANNSATQSTTVVLEDMQVYLPIILGR